MQLNMSIFFQLTTALDKSTVHMKDSDHVLSLVRQMSSDGKDKLQVNKGHISQTV